MSKSPRDIRERTFDFAVRILKPCHELDEKPGVSRNMSRQLLNSGTSVGANAEEAQAAQSKPDFISKNSIALKEARETHYWLRLLIAAEIMPEKKLTELRDEAEELKAYSGIDCGLRQTFSTNFIRKLFPFTFYLFPWFHAHLDRLS
jgi:four helix bundle protein